MEEQHSPTPPPFRVPEHYFSGAQEKIMQKTVLLKSTAESKALAGVSRHPHAIFGVSAGYFETLPWKIRARVGVSQTASSWLDVLISWKPLVPAAAFSLLMVLFIAGWWQHRTQERPEIRFASHDIVNYLENEDDQVVVDEMTTLAVMQSEAQIIPGEYDYRILEQELEDEEFITEEL